MRARPDDHFVDFDVGNVLIDRRWTGASGTGRGDVSVCLPGPGKAAARPSAVDVMAPGGADRVDRSRLMLQSPLPSAAYASHRESLVLQFSAPGRP